MKKGFVSEIVNVLGFILILIIIFFLGFFFGTKYIQNENKQNYTYQSMNTNSDNDQSSSSNFEIKELNEVYWIKVGQEPVCPAEYPIKGTFSDNNGFFYNKENKMYDRIKPDICFIDENFASSKAGFIKKF